MGARNQHLALSCHQPVVLHCIATSEVIHHLPARVARYSQIVVNGVVEKRADTGGLKPKRFSRHIQSLSDGASLEVDVSIAPVSVRSAGAFQIADHRKSDARISRQILSQTETGSHHALIAGFDLLQARVLRIVLIDTRSEIVDAVDVEVEFN